MKNLDNCNGAFKIVFFLPNCEKHKLNFEKKNILEKTYKGTSSLDFRRNKINPLCYSSGTWRV